MRTLALTSPVERGDDVKRLQEALNERLHARRFAGVAVDGQYGTDTDHAVAKVKYILGWPSDHLHTGIGPTQLKWITDPGTRPAAFKSRTQVRLKEVEAARHRAAAAQTGPERAIAYARAHLGVHETGDSNWGGQVEAWLKAVDCGPAPWCGAFAHACLAAAGVKNLSYRMRYVPYIVADAHAGVNGLVRLVPFGLARPGDLICFDWDGDGVQDHVALYLGGGVTIEGNTTRDPSAPPERQGNGGEVCVRRRGTGHAALWSAVARPHYVH